MPSRPAVREQIVEVLKELNEQERELLSRVLRIERDKLYQERPRVKEEILRAVREVIK